MFPLITAHVFFGRMAFFYGKLLQKAFDGGKGYLPVAESPVVTEPAEDFCTGDFGIFFEKETDSFLHIRI